MRIHKFRKSMTNGSAALILAGLLGVTWVASAATDTKKPAAPAPKAAPKAAPAKSSAPAGGAKTGTAGGAHTGAATTGAHTTTTTTHPTTTTSHTPTTTTGTHTTAGPGGTHPGGTGAASAHGGAAGGSKHTAFKSPAPKGSTEHVTKSGSAVRTRPGGRVADVHDAKRGVDVHHGLTGGHRTVMERHDGSRVYAERGRRGYVERGYNYHGHDFARRSYFYHGRSYDRFYRGYGYHGLMLNVYAPGFYFRPAFYGWAYNPWVAPISFGWGWGVATPWYGFYGGYFQPYPVYPSAAFWLTDYIISQDLAAAYAAHQEAAEQASAPPAGGPPALTPEVKQMIADEVKAQLALENSEAGQNAQQQDVDPGSSGIARLLSDGRPHVFVAGGNLDVTDASGQECAVSDGDTLQLREPPPSDATAANLVVLSSKGNPECQISLTVQIQLTDLQEMQNHMRETIDQGLQDLQAKQGTGGLPAAPPSAAGPTAPATYAAAAPPPEANPSADIQQADQQSAQAEKDVTTEAAADTGAGGQASAAAPDGSAPPSPDAPAAPAQPASVELGQTTDQVTAALGAPTRIANLGPKVIYYYSGMKVTFKEGKVSDVQ